MSLMGDSNKVTIDCVQSTSFEVENIIIKITNKSCNIKKYSIIDIQTACWLHFSCNIWFIQLFSTRKKYFLQHLKITKIIALHRSGNVNDINNYCCALCQRFQKIKASIVEFVSSRDIIIEVKINLDSEKVITQVTQCCNFLDQVY